LKSIAERRSKTESQELKTNNCIDWYLVTTYYNADGSSESTWHYISTTCNCEQTKIAAGGRNYRLNCSGGGGADVDYEFAVAKEVDWKVADNPSAPPGSGSGIYSHERLKGKRVASAAYGGYFNGGFHRGSDCNFCSDNNPSYDVWTETSTNLIPEGNIALSRVNGTLQYKGGTTFHEKTKTWKFNEIF
jgi:hypothetical protein